MKATAMRGLPVSPQGSAGVTGTVSDFLLDLEERRILALQVTSDDGTVYVLDVGDVESVEDREVNASADAVLLPQADAEQYETLPTLGRMLEEKAMTESGRVLGKLTDIDVDTTTWVVTGYGVVSNFADALQHGEQEIPTTDVLNAGAHVLLVKDNAAGDDRE